MYKKVNVVMLPTNEKATNIVKILKDTISYTTSENIPGGIYQHLYITSDEEIKEGDWFYNTFSDNQPLIQQRKGNWKTCYNQHKIIATNDTRVKNQMLLDGFDRTYPQIPQQFIEYYVSEYNKGNVITEVMVEYLRGSGGYYDENEVWPQNWVILGVLINQDNTINIKPVKDSYSRIEVEELIYSAMKDILYTTVAEFKKWMEENL